MAIPGIFDIEQDDWLEERILVETSSQHRMACSMHSAVELLSRIDAKSFGQARVYGLSSPQPANPSTSLHHMYAQCMSSALQNSCCCAEPGQIGWYTARTSYMY